MARELAGSDLLDELRHIAEEPEILEDIYADIVEALDVELSNDEAMFGADEPEEDGPALLGGQGSQRDAHVSEIAEVGDPMHDAIEVVDTVAAAFLEGADAGDAPEVPGASSSSSAEVLPAAPTEFPPCGFVISPLGYVRCNRPGHDPQKTVGLVALKTNDKAMFANCHLHSKCSITVGMIRNPVSKETMAEWLCKGIPPPPEMRRADTRQLGIEHRQLWKRS